MYSLTSSIDSDIQLGKEIADMAGQMNAYSYRFLKLIGSFDDRKAWNCDGTIRSCAHWLNWQCGIAMGAAREKLRVAHCLDTLPLIDASFETGEISYSKVRAMTRVATPENEDFLLMIARHGTASHMEQVVGKYQGVSKSLEKKNCSVQDEADQEDARKLVYYQDNDGMWVIHAKLPPEAGSLVVKALEAVAKPEQEEKQKEIREKLKQQREECVSAETWPEAVIREDPCNYQGLLQHTRADALITIAEHFLATTGEVQGLKGSERCQVVLHVDINTLREANRAQNPEHEHCNLDNSHWLTRKTARRLACDASLLTVLEDEQGEVLNIGRKARTVPASIRRALDVRDKTCRFPGCCESKHVDAHHIQHWADGGDTSLDNLVTLCRFHHAQLHRGCFDIRKHKKQLIFTTPSGKQLETSLFPQFPGKPEVPPHMGTRDCTPKWDGETCDYGIAVEGLLRRKYLSPGN